MLVPRALDRTKKIRKTAADIFAIFGAGNLKKPKKKMFLRMFPNLSVHLAQNPLNPRTNGWAPSFVLHKRTVQDCPCSLHSEPTHSSLLYSQFQLTTVPVQTGFGSYGSQPFVRGFSGIWAKSTEKSRKNPEKILIFSDFFVVFQAQISRKYPRRSCGSLWSGLELWRPTLDRFRLIFLIFVVNIFFF